MTSGTEKKQDPIRLKPVVKSRIAIRIRGLEGSPLITHKWSEKAIRQIEEKGKGKKTKDRDARDPTAEADAATYWTEDNQHGVPAMAVKKAMVSAAHKDIGFEKTLVRKSIFVSCKDRGGVLPLILKQEPEIDVSPVRVGQGSADIRYRPVYRDWELDLDIEYDQDMVTPEDIVNLLNRAGFGIGLCEGRPEKNGENGRWEVSTEAVTNEKKV